MFQWCCCLPSATPLEALAADDEEDEELRFLEAEPVLADESRLQKKGEGGTE